MAFSRTIRVWKFKARRVRCRQCRQWMQLVIDDRGKHLPFAKDAAPMDETATDRGVFLIFDAGTAFHHCPAKPRVASRTDSQQERFW